MNRTYMIMGGIAVVSLAAGGAGGYIIAEKRLRKEYSDISTRDIAAAKEFYKMRAKADEYETPAKAVERLIPENEFTPVVEDTPELKAAIDALKTYAEGPSEGEPESVGTTEVEVRNVFQVSRSGWNHELEMSRRDPTQPYVITHQEFLENEGEYEQSTVTYFVGDDVLADSTDSPIREVDRVIGEDSLALFGHGSEDNNIVYVRNDRLEIDFEVLKAQGKFSKVVLGFDDGDEDRRQRPQKLRRGDDG